MAGLHIGAPTRLHRGGRAVQPGSSSTPLVRDPGELLSHNFSGSSARVDYGRQLELNTQDGEEDMLFRQEIRYPERGAGGFSNIRWTDGGESRASPPVQPPEEPRRPLGSEPASEQSAECGASSGGARRTGSALAVRRMRPEQVSAMRGWNLPVTEERDEVHHPMQVATLGAADLGQERRRLTGCPCRQAQCQRATATWFTAS
jgi:hypothetical protein